MGILGIENRTENWKTAYYFSAFFKNPAARISLANKLLTPYEGTLALEGEEETELQLFWYGIRDYLKHEKLKVKDVSGRFLEIYNKCFRQLRQKVSSFQTNCSYNVFEVLKEHNYDGSKHYPTERNTNKLSENLNNTEFDIVLKTPGYLFVGEAKHESNLGANGNLILVHQLIRQYVTARVLVELTGKQVKVVPFVVADAKGHASMLKTVQVQFMMNQGWLKESNVLSWEQVEELGCGL